MKHKLLMKHRERGLTLVELIVAIAVFAIIMLALSGTIVNGLQVRRKNSAQAHAVAYANSVIEQYKSFWSDSDNYNKYGTPGHIPNIPLLPAALGAGSGFTKDVQADLCASYNSVTKKFDPYADANACKTAKGGDLRFITVIVKDPQGKELVKLTAEIGKPVL
jgi:prepilin-type N-terminal cleavage/methylation domain-containing protein